MVILLLKTDGVCDLFPVERQSFRCSDQFIFHIVETVYDTDDFSGIRLDRDFYAQKIYVKFFTVATDRIGNIAVVDGIEQIGVPRMGAAQGTVDFDLYCLAQIGTDQSAAKDAANQILFSLKVFLPPAFGRYGFGKINFPLFVFSGSFRTFVEVIPEVYIVSPCRTACGNDMDKVCLQIAASIVIAAAGEQKLSGLRRFWAIVKSVVLKFFLEFKDIF